MTPRGGPLVMRFVAIGLVVVVLSAPAAADDTAVVKRVTELGGKVEREGGKPTGAIRTIFLNGRAATDADMKLVATVASLNYLTVQKSKVTDDGLKELAKLKALTYLSLEGTAVTGKGLKHVNGLKLESLLLDDCPLDDAGLEPLAKMKTLKTLTFKDQKNITDAGVKHLAGLTELTLLHLDGTGVTPAGLGSLAKLKNLQDLGLARTAFDDAGFKHLEKLTGLQRVMLLDTKVTKAGVDKAAKTMPKLKVLN